MAGNAVVSRLGYTVHVKKNKSPVAHFGSHHNCHAFDWFGDIGINSPHHEFL